MAKGMGPDGRFLSGNAYTRFVLQQALLTRKGTYPMRGDLGSDIPMRIGEPTNETTRALTMGNVADVIDQLGGEVVLKRANATFSDRKIDVVVDVTRQNTGENVSFEGLVVE